MTRLTGTFLFSLALCVVASVAVAGSPNAYTLAPAPPEPSNAVTIQAITPVARTQTTKPQPSKIYIADPKSARTQGVIYAPANEPVQDSSGYVITPAPTTTVQ